MLIALVGVKNSGKDAVADIIQKYVRAERMAFANKLKEVCSNQFNLDMSFFHDRLLKESDLNTKEALGYIRSINILEDFGINTSNLTIEQVNYIGSLSIVVLDTPRSIMQIVGSQLLRHFDIEIHLKTIEIEKLTGINIVTDVRMPNELKYLSGYPGKFVPLYIQRDSAEEKVTENSHESEKNVFLIRDNCIKINNNGSLEDLEDVVVGILNLKDSLLEEVV